MPWTRPPFYLSIDKINFGYSVKQSDALVCLPKCTINKLDKVFRLNVAHYWNIYVWLTLPEPEQNSAKNKRFLILWNTARNGESDQNTPFRTVL